MKKLGKVVLWVVGVLVVVLVAARIALPTVVVKVADKAMAESLTTGGSLGNVDFSLLGGRVVVEDLVIPQDPAFPSSRTIASDLPPLVKLGALDIDVSVKSLNTDQIVVEHVGIDGLELNLVRNTNGVLNIASITKPAESEVDEADTDQPASAQAGPSVHVKSVTVTNVVVRYRDEALAEHEALELTVKQVALVVSDLYAMGGPEGEVLPGRISLLITIDQKDKAPAYVGLQAAVGVIGEGIPAVNARLLLGGLYLDTLDVIVPPATAAALGGAQLDSSVKLQVAEDMLLVQGKTITQGHEYELEIGGTPYEPKVKAAGLLFDVLGRGLGIGVQAVSNVGEAGLEVGKGVAKGGTELVKGSGKAVASVGKGLFGTVKGVATLDMKGAREGLSQATVGTVKEVGNTVVDTTAAVGGGLMEAGRTAVGVTHSQSWSDEQMNRWNSAWQSAKVEIGEMPYPKPDGNGSEGEQSPAVEDEEEDEPLASD